MAEHDEFERFYREHVDGIFRFIKQILGNDDEAEELTAEVFFRAYRSLSKLRNPNRARAWLYRIAYNLCMDELERRGKAVIVPLDEELKIAHPPAKGPSPQDVLEEEEIAAWVREVLIRLSPGHRTALILGEVEGLSNREIAEVMGKSPAAVKSLRQRARKAFKREMLRLLEKHGLTLDDLLKT